MEQLDNINISKTIDIRGKICPYTLIETREGLKSMRAGEVLEVICDHPPAAKETIPSFCEKKKYPYKVIEEGSHYRIYIKKTD